MFVFNEMCESDKKDAWETMCVCKILFYIYPIIWLRGKIIQIGLRWPSLFTLFLWASYDKSPPYWIIHWTSSLFQQILPNEHSRQCWCFNYKVNDSTTKLHLPSPLSLLLPLRRYVFIIFGSAFHNALRYHIVNMYVNQPYRCVRVWVSVRAYRHCLYIHEYCMCMQTYVTDLTR